MPQIANIQHRVLKDFDKDAAFPAINDYTHVNEKLLLCNSKNSVEHQIEISEKDHRGKVNIVAEKLRSTRKEIGEDLSKKAIRNDRIYTDNELPLEGKRVNLCFSSQRLQPRAPYHQLLRSQPVGLVGKPNNKSDQ